LTVAECLQPVDDVVVVDPDLVVDQHVAKAHGLAD
jgi:hypothetical protein